MKTIGIVALMIAGGLVVGSALGGVLFFEGPEQKEQSTDTPPDLVVRSNEFVSTTQAIAKSHVVETKRARFKDAAQLALTERPIKKTGKMDTALMGLRDKLMQQTDLLTAECIQKHQIATTDTGPWSCSSLVSLNEQVLKFRTLNRSPLVWIKNSPTGQEEHLALSEQIEPSLALYQARQTAKTQLVWLKALIETADTACKHNDSDYYKAQIRALAVQRAKELMDKIQALPAIELVFSAKDQQPMLVQSDVSPIEKAREQSENEGWLLELKSICQ